MDPVTLSILAGSGAATGFFEHQAQVKKDKAQMMANAAQIEYSPWTGMKSQVQGPQANSLFGDMAKGALGFGMMGSQFNKPAAPAQESAWNSPMFGKVQAQQPNMYDNAAIYGRTS